MEILKTKTLTPTQYAQIDALWNEEYPAKLQGRFGILLDGVADYDHYIMLDGNGDLAAWAVVFEKDGERRFSVIVGANYKGQKLGSTLMQRLKAEEPEFYGWVIDHDEDRRVNGAQYLSPLGFYERLGFEVLRDMRIDTEMLRAVKVRWRR